MINQSTTPAATSLCCTFAIIVLRPPLLQKGGENSLLCIYDCTLRLTSRGQGVNGVSP